MAAGKRRSLRQLAMDISGCVGASFSGKRVEWEGFVKTGQLVVWQSHPLPDTPAIAEARERLKREQEQNG